MLETKTSLLVQQHLQYLSEEQHCTQIISTQKNLT